jgi:tripartite-type tricarboxylate transporter receptor subunit TctC
MIKRLLLLLFFYLVTSAHAVEFVVSSSPGGPGDTITRKISEIIVSNTDIKPIILNKPGAAHTIAYNYILNSSRPSLIISTTEITHHPVFDQLRVVKTIGTFTLHIVVNSDSKISSLRDLAALSQKKSILFGNSGSGTYSYFGMSKVCATSLNCLPVQYKSAAEGVFAIMGNHIDAYALVSYGAGQILNNKMIRSVHEMVDSSYIITLYSKNVSASVINTIQNVLSREIPKEFYMQMNIREP